MVSQSNVRERFNTDEETWPPDQPKNFTPLLIRHQGQHSMKQATTMAQIIQTCQISEIISVVSDQSVPKHHPKLDLQEQLQKVPDRGTVTKELTETLAPLEQSKEPQFILIEGAPGIGKSIFLKEIAYRWGNKQLLKTFKLVLLVRLCDPTVQQTSLLADLLQLCCKRGDTRATYISTTCSDYLVRNDGKDLVFLFDGYDEYPEELHKDTLIADILKRKVLPHCALVVSSRPHATVYLRERATVRVDILGFTEIEQNQFIQQALKEQPQSIKELTQYLEDHFTISSLCVVPFNMVVLLFLYKQEIPLPNNSTELCNHFICLTICRHLAKNGHSLNNTITDLTHLPDPYNKVIQQLSKLSLEAFNDKKLDFTLDEIKAACPDIETIPGAINGFGLLQAVQHFGLTGKTVTFSFLHLSIQEFLAAYYITCLPPNNELKILKSKFWSDDHSNVFAMYIALTKGQRPSFKQFLKPSLGQWLKGCLTGTKVANRFINDKLKCFYLFRRFFEAGDEEISRSIEDKITSKDKIICINDNYVVDYDSIIYTLSLSDVECVAFFLTHSLHMQWKEINLQGCYIQDHGIQILNRGLTNFNVVITRLVLSHNGLTESSSSDIRDITIRCKVKELDIGGNSRVGEDEKLYSIIYDPSSMLKVLRICSANLSSSAAIKLFTLLSEGNKLSELQISNNNITDEVYNAVINLMEKTVSLVSLAMYWNPISRECKQQIIGAFKYYNTISYLYI